MKVILRPANSNDADLLRQWESSPHLSGLLGDDDWQWEASLSRPSPAHQPMIAEVEGRPVGFLEILDPSRDPGCYWGALSSGYRAIDLWIGEPAFLGRGIGRAMMRMALDICFADKEVHTVLVDPLASNAASHRFYERCGFCFIGHRKFGEDECFVFQIERSVWEALV